MMKTQKMIYSALLFAGLFFLASCQPVDFDGPQPHLRLLLPRFGG